MKFALAAIATALIAGVVADTANSTPDDVTILQYALTLEHLEDNFYHQGLAKYSASDFSSAGLDRSKYELIASHEATHVAFLTTAIGSKAVKACTYKFPDTDAKSFAAVAAVLESVGQSAYLGAAQFIKDKGYLTAAAAILTVESNHYSAARDQIGVNPIPSAFNTPLGLSQVYSLAAPFIVKCPSSNAKLPVQAFPALTTKSSSVKPGDQVKFTFTPKKGKTTYIAWFDGLAVQYSKVSNGMAKVPSGLAPGLGYAIATTANGQGKDVISDSNTVAGPAQITIV